MYLWPGLTAGHLPFGAGSGSSHSEKWPVSVSFYEAHVPGCLCPSAPHTGHCGGQLSHLQGQ